MLVEKKILSDHFEAIYVSWFSRMKYFALEYVVSEEDAENIVQDVFTELWERKEILAYELTKLVHGEEEAKKAQDSAKALFASGNAADMPEVVLTDDDFEEGSIGILRLLVKAGLAPSNGEARRNVEQGGVSVDGEKVTDPKAQLTKDTFAGDGVVLKRGKKKFMKIVLG